MDVKAIESIYPLSSMQKGILFYSIQNDQELYFQQNVLEAHGDIDLDALNDSLNLLLQTYDVLRAVILYEGLDDPVHVIPKERKGKVRFFDISQSSNREVELREIVQKDKERSFQLSKDLLFRLTVVKLEDHFFHIIVSYHHIIIDGWSATLLVTKLFNYYYEFLKGKEPPLIAAPPFAEYIYKCRQQEKDHVDYWQKYLDEYDHETEFSSKHEASASGSTLYETYVLDEQQKQMLFQLASRNNVTVNIIIKGILAILFQRYVLADDVVFGEIVSGRNDLIEDMESMVGLFINMLPVRVQTSHEATFSTMTKDMQRDALQSYQHMHISLSDIQKKCYNGRPLIRLFYNFSNHPKTIDLDVTDANTTIGFDVVNVDIAGDDNYDFCITVMPLEQYSITIRYSSDQYENGFIKAIFSHFFAVLNQVFADQDILIRDICLMIPADKQKLLRMVDHHDEHLIHCSQTTLPHVLQSAARRFGENTAIRYGDRLLSYSDLNDWADRLAYRLEVDGVRRGDVVGVLMDKSFDLVAAMLAILKVGGIFLPLDTNYPIERLQFIIDDSGATTILTDRNNASVHQRCQWHQYDIEKLPPGVPSDDNAQPADAAYLLYTSGTTGYPKGVLLAHSSIVHYAHIFLQEFRLTTEDVVLQQSSVSFDVFIEEVIPALMAGASLLLMDRDTLFNMRKVENEFSKHRVTVVSCSPRYLHMLSKQALSSVSLFISGGETLKKSYFKHIAKDAVVYNTYGPTETTVCATYHRCTEDDQENIPIGRSLSNCMIRVLDQHGNIQPKYVNGEIYIGGIGVSLGYLNHVELTADRFTTVDGEGMVYFRTGDIGQWTENGEIRFINRNDRLVKLRGYRVELGEVERAILAVPGVSDAFVTIIEEHESLSRYLCAFVTGDAGLNKDSIVDHIMKRLPHYMVPQRIRIVDQIIMTPNAKVDNAAMMAFMQESQSDEGRTDDYQWKETEQKLRTIWSKVLKVTESSIQPHDSFFEMGGDSIILIQLSAYINECFPDMVSISDLFIYHNIAEVAAYIERKEQEKIMPAALPSIPSHTCRVQYTLYEASCPKFNLPLYASVVPGTTVDMVDVFTLLCSLTVGSMPVPGKVGLYRIGTEHDVIVPVEMDWNEDGEIADVIKSIAENRPENKPHSIFKKNEQDTLSIVIGKISSRRCQNINLYDHFNMILSFDSSSDEILVHCEYCEACAPDSFIEGFLTAVMAIPGRIERYLVESRVTK